MKLETVRIVAKNTLGYATVNKKDMPKGARLYKERKRRVEPQRVEVSTDDNADHNPRSA